MMMTLSSSSQETSVVEATLGTQQRYHQRLAQLKSQRQTGFIPFTLLGWPDKARCKRTLELFMAAEPAALELGIPFSDPVADGPIIQEAVQDVLAQNFRYEDALELIAYARSLNPEIPIGLLLYLNSALAQGLPRFYQQVRQAGADGILMADLPPESAQEAVALAQANDLAQIFIVSPMTSPVRLTQFAQQASGFFYVMSRLGITGVETHYDTGLRELMEALRPQSQLPFYVGFGISKPEQVQQMAKNGADGVITGSAILQLIRQSEPHLWEEALKTYLDSMVQAGQLSV
jgi:tryptophan synthase alpha chain